MPNLVQRRADVSSVSYEVRTTLLPFFAAVDTKLIAHVDRRLNEWFRNTEDKGEQTEEEMSSVVVEAIIERRPYPGLREVLEALLALDFETQLPEDQIPNLQPLEPRRVVEAKVIGLDGG